MFHEKYKRKGQVEDLDAALAHCQSAESEFGADTDPLGRSGLLGTFASCYGERYRRTGSLEDLEAAFRYNKEGLELSPPGNDNRKVWFFNNAVFATDRFRRIGAVQDLNNAIANIQKALELAGPTHADRVVFLNGLSFVAQTKYEATHEEAALKLAMEAAKEAYKLSKPNSSVRGVSALILSRIFQKQFRGIEDITMDELVTYGQEAVDCIPNGHPYKSGAFNHLSELVRSQYEDSRNIKDINKAVKLARDAVTAAGEAHSDFALALQNSGIALLKRGTDLKQREDLQEAADTFKKATEVQNALPITKVRSALNAGLTLSSMENWEEASEFFGLAMKELPRLNTRMLSRFEQRELLRRLPQSSSVAAAVSLQAGHSASEALAMMEASRNLMATLTINARSDESELAILYPKAFAEWSTKRDTVARMGFRTQYTNEQLAHFEAITDVRLRMEAVKDLEMAEECIRKLDGFQNFQLPFQEEEFKRLANSGAIVAFNVTTFRNDAFIVTSNGVTSIQLEDIEESVIEDTARLMMAMVKGSPNDRRDRNMKLSGSLMWLWQQFVRPVLGHLQLLQPPANEELSRIWWVTNGVLCMAPFHAAGELDQSSGENTWSKVVSCYTPSIKALKYANSKHRLLPNLFSETFLGISMPETGSSMANLPGVTTKVASFFEILKDAGLNSSSSSVVEYPSKAGVLKKLETASIIHFACHGLSDELDPSLSCLLVKQEDVSGPDHLTVQDLEANFHGAVSKAQLAYLSACSTVENRSEDLKDETIHIASAFQLLGFPGVIGTLWEADYAVADYVARLFYEKLAARVKSLVRQGTVIDLGPECANALHKAVGQLRRNGLPGSRKMKNSHLNVIAWAPFVYLGC